MSLSTSLFDDLLYRAKLLIGVASFGLYLTKRVNVGPFSAANSELSALLRHIPTLFVTAAAQMFSRCRRVFDAACKAWHIGGMG
jgi:hypothetical protein